MQKCTLSHHNNHSHTHGQNCGHVAIKHNDHVCYVHDGHLHHPHQDHIDEHVLEITEINPNNCTPEHTCCGHDADHMHGPDCGHEAVPHGDHICYIVDGHLHHPHGDHCDNHGPVQVVK